MVHGRHLAQPDSQIASNQDVAGVLSMRFPQPSYAGVAVSADEQSNAHELQALYRQHGNVRCVRQIPQSIQILLAHQQSQLTPPRVGIGETRCLQQPLPGRRIKFPDADAPFSNDHCPIIVSVASTTSLHFPGRVSSEWA